MAETKKTMWEELRKPFPKEAVGKVNKGFGDIDFVGHAAVTDRLNTVDPTWTWEPMGLTEHGTPYIDDKGGLWIKLTIGEVTRIGYGDNDGKTGPNATKVAIGDAIKNAAMRFGVALDLWSKDELESHIDTPAMKNPKPTIDPPSPEEPSISINDIHAERLSTTQVAELLKLAKGKGAKNKAEAIEFINRAVLSDDFTMLYESDYKDIRAAVLSHKFAEVE